MDCLLLPSVFPKLLFNNSKSLLYSRRFLSSLNTKTNAKKLFLILLSLSLSLSLSLVVKFIPMEKSLLSSELISFIILETILSFFTRFLKLSKRFLSFPSRSSKATKTQLRAEEARGDAQVLIMREEVELVMERMGLKMTGNEKGEPKLKEFMGMEEVVAMFDDKEPSLEEVKEAFAVFDENGDGFVDAVELQRVLWKLGFEGMGLDSCRAMIGAHDENGDGKIDFGEFVKFMESSLC